jgi:hypothetical protein
MIQRIREYIPNEPIQFKINPESGETEIHFLNKKTKTTIQSLHQLNKQVYLKPDECSICHEKEPCNIRRVTCKKCTSELCINCYVQVFKNHNKQCPFCLFTYGEKFGVHMIKDNIRGIL